MSEKKCKNHPDRPAVIRSDGISRGLCPECLNANMKRAQRARKGQGDWKPDPPEVGRPRGTRKRRDQGNGLDAEKIKALFDDYPDLLQKVKELAREEFRPLEMEILFLLQVQTQDGPGSGGATD